MAEKKYAKINPDIMLEIWDNSIGKAVPLKRNIDAKEVKRLPFWSKNFKSGDGYSLVCQMFWKGQRYRVSALIFKYNENSDDNPSTT